MMARAAWVPCVCALLGACFTLDDRELHVRPGSTGGAGEGSGDASGGKSGGSGAAGGVPDDGGEGGDPTAAGAPNASGGASGSAGTGGSGGLVNGCADLDTDGVADCEATLVTTPTFTENVEGWTPADDSTLTWDPMNALDDGPSGSARLSAEGLRARAQQCVAVGGSKLVIAYASAFVETGDEQEPGRGVLEVSFFDSNDCGGERSGFFETPPSSVMGEWTTVQAGGVSGDATRSVSIALVGVKPASAEAINVFFDNVMLKAKAP